MERLLRGAGWAVRKSPLLGLVLLGYLYLPQLDLSPDLGQGSKLSSPGELQQVIKQISTDGAPTLGAVDHTDEVAQEAGVRPVNPYAQRLKELGVESKVMGDQVIYPEDLKDFEEIGLQGFLEKMKNKQ